MILLPILPLQTPLPAVARAHPDEVARARAFLHAAHIGLDGKLLPPYKPDNTLYEVDDDLAHSGIRSYWFSSGTVSFTIGSGRLHGYFGSGRTSSTASVHNPDGSYAPRRVTDALAAALAQRFYNAAGYPGEIALTAITDGMGDEGQDLEMHYVRAYAGVPFSGFGDDELISMDRQTGRLDTFDAPSPYALVDFPASVAPGGTLEQARLAAVRIAQSWQKLPVEEDEARPLRLVLWYPLLSPSSRNAVTPQRVLAFGPEHVAAYRANRAILAFRGTLRDADGMVYDAVLDARTGRALQIDRFRPAYASPFAGGATPAPKLPPLVVPSGSRPWRVDTGKEGWGGWTAPATSALVPAPGQPVPTKGTKLALTDGKAAFPALYDPASGLVGISGKAYRPGPALAALLKRRTKG